MTLSFILGHKLKPKDGIAEITTTYIHLNDTDIMKAIPFIDNIYHPAALSKKIDQ